MKRLAMAASPPMKGVQRKSAASSARRQDTHERQAETLARRFVRGETGLGDRVIPAEPAAFSLATSSGKPLPPAIRRDLETAFGADLSQVRVHDDAASAGAAALLRARAFASGSSLYFGARAFAPGSNEGRELIAHEVVHVLQQTGRTNSGGLLEARPITGSGVPQLQDQAGPDVPGVPERFESLAAAHRRISGPAGDLEVTITDVSRLVGGNLLDTGVRPAFAWPLVEAVRSGTFSARHVRSRSFVTDCLKWLGYHHTARAVLDTDTRLEMVTLVHSRDFFTFLQSMPDSADWGGGALRHRSLSEYWPSVIVSPFRQFLLTPHAPPPIANPRLLQRANEILLERPAPGLISSTAHPQDRVLLAWSVLVQLDVHRVRDCNSIRGEIEGQYGGLVPTERLARGVEHVKIRESEIVTDFTAPSYRRDLAEALIVMLDRDVLPVWGNVLASFIELRLLFESFHDLELITGAPRQDADDRPPFPTNPDRSPITVEIGRVLLDQVRLIFPEGSGRALAQGHGPDAGDALPAPAVYAQRLSDFVTALGTSYDRRGRRQQSILEQIDALIAEASRGRRPNVARVRSLALLSWVTDTLIKQAQGYDPARDTQTPHFPDELGAHRIRFARAYARFARWMGWNSILAEVARAVPVERFTTAGVTRVAQIWLESDWRPDSATVERMRDDFPQSAHKPVFRGLDRLPVTLNHVITWFNLRHDERLTIALRNQLVQEHRSDDQIRINIREFQALRMSPEEVRQRMKANAEEELATSAVDSFTNLPQPQRFVVDEWEAVVPQGQEEQWDWLLYWHPKTQLAIVRRVTAPYSYVLLPSEVRGAFLWVIPPIGELVELIAGLQTIRAFTEFTGDLAAYMAQLTDTHDDDFLLWQRIDDAIAQGLAARYRPTREALPMLQTRFTTLRRRSLTFDVRTRLEAYLNDRRVTGGSFGETPAQRVRRVTGPQDALDKIVAFSTDVSPRADTDAQTTLLMLRIADLMARLFTTEYPEYRLAPSYYALVSQALEFSGDRERMRQMSRISNEYDVAAGNVALIEERLAAARRQLQQAKEAIEANARASQRQLGFESDTRGSQLVLMSSSFQSGEIYPTSETNPDPQHQWYRNLRMGPEGELDESTGEVIRVLAVYRRFQYIPHVGEPGRSTPYVPAIYFDSDGTEYGGQTGRAIPDHPLFRIQIGDSITIVKANDPPALLAYYNELFLWRSLQIHLENLGAVSQAAMQWIIAGVTLAVPGVAQAELATNVVAFVASGELDQVIDHLANDPRGFVNDLITQLEGLFSPEDIWKFVLLAGQHNPWNALRTRRQPTTSLRSAPPRTRLGRIVRSLRLLGERFHNALNRIRERARGPIRTVQGNVAMRPTLAWILRRAIRVLEILPDLWPPEFTEAAFRGDVPLAPADIRSAVTGRIAETGEDLRANTIRLLESIQHFELPSELIDLTVATELIVQLIADRFGPKARIIRMLLEITPVPQGQQGRFTGFRSLYSYLCDEIAQRWRGSGVDPNELWRKEIVPEIEPKFLTIRNNLVTDLYGGINRGLTAFQFPTIDPPASDSLPTTQMLHESLDTQASMSSSPSALGSGVWRLGRTGASALPHDLRRSFETGFGQQFPHVRLITGQAGRSATSPIGADAVTSGSHVYLRPGLSPSSASGQRVLAHELAHVVQQTGSHPIGGDDTPLSRMGRPGHLRIDRPAEAAADRAASAFMAGTPSSLGDQPAAPQGVAPTLSEGTLNSIVATLTEVRTERDFTADPTSTGPTAGLDDARNLFEQIWRKLGALNVSSAADFADFTANPTGHPTPNVRQRIKEHVTRDKAALTRAIEGIARLSQQPRTPAVSGQPPTELKRGRFVDLLESYIYAERGIGLKVTADPTWHNVTNVKVISVALERIGGTSDLWTVAVHAGFAGRSITVDANLQNAVRQRIRVLGHTILVWDRNEFKLSRAFVDDFMAMKEQALRGSVTDVPPKAEYLNTGQPRGDVLSVSTHGRLTSGLGIGGYGRESHHTTQFLLAEFFGNRPDATRGAFPSHHARYPTAVKFATPGATSGPVRAIEAAGHAPIQIAALDPSSGRGDAMPAILLSARTHRRGGLHVLQESTWDGDAEDSKDRDNSTSQGIAIENVFTRHLPANLRPRANTDQARANFANQIAAHPSESNQSMYNAVANTYAWMHGRMIPALETGLKTEEVAYYRSIAALSHTTGGTSDNPDLAPAYDLEAADMAAVFTAAKNNNNTVMSGFGWPTPS